MSPTTTTPARATAARLAPLVLLASLALFGTTPAAAQEGEATPRRAPPLALVGATLHPVSGPAIEDATLLVVDGRIAAISGAGVALEVPPETIRVDLRGQHLYPGLIDADSILGLLEVSSVAGTRDVDEVGRINPNLRVELAVNPDSDLLAAARTGGVLLTHVAARSGLIAGTTAVLATDGWTFEDMTLRAPVFLSVRWPSMDVRPSARRPVAEQRAEREEALDALRQAFRDARGYWKAREAFGARQPDEDPKWDAMRGLFVGAARRIAPLRPAGDGPGQEEGELGGSDLGPGGLQRAMRVAVTADTLMQIRAALSWAEDERVGMVLVGGGDAWRAAQALRIADVPVILGPVHRLPLRDYEGLDAPFRNAGLLHEAGVRIAFSSGGSPFGAAGARNLRHHAALAVAHGLPADAAVRALTLGAAEVLGVEHRVGSLELGKDATLIAVDGPLLGSRSLVTQAWIAGREVSLTDRHRRLYERYRERPAR